MRATSASNSLDRPDVVGRPARLRSSGRSRSHSPRRSRSSPSSIDGDASSATTDPPDGIERAGDRERESTGSRPDVEPRLTGPHEPQERVQDGIVGPGRVGAEERLDRRVEVGPVGNLADPLDLIAVGADAGGPGRLDRTGEVGGRVHVRVRAVDRDLRDELGMGGQDRPETPVAGRLADEPEGRPAKEDGVATSLVGVDRHDDRPAAPGRRVQQRTG